jgi:hypothetical protein
LRRGVLIAAALAALIAAPVAQPARGDALIEVVVTIDGPPLAYAISKSRVLTGRVRAQRLNVRAPTSLGYLASLATTQHALAARITTSIPDSRITWRYGVVLNGLAVVVPRSQLGRLGSMPGVDRVWPNVTYRPLLDRSPGLIGAPQMWGMPSFSTAGNGIKIGIIDDGVDQAHPFFDPAGYTMPPGFPKGDTAYTTAKVIAARAFPAPETHWPYAKVPFDPKQSEHATHVAGIAAGDYTPNAIAGRGAALRRRPARVHRELQGAHLSDRELRPERECARDRRRRRSGGQGRNGCDQPLARRGRDRPLPATSSPRRSMQRPTPESCR